MKHDLGIEVTSNIDDILKNKHIDLVDICLHSELHKKYVVEALRNGKHVFCETPVALTVEDVIEIKEAEEYYGKRVFVNLFIKHEYPNEYLYKTIKDNSLGKLKALHIRRKTAPLWGDLSLNKITTSLMIHDLDFATALLGMPKIYTL